MSKDKIVKLPDNINLLSYRFDSRSLEELKEAGGFKDRRRLDEHFYQSNFSLDAGNRFEGELPSSDNLDFAENFSHPHETFIPSNAGAHSGGISVTMHPIGGMNAVGSAKKNIYLHILSVGEELVPVSSLFQTREQLRESINRITKREYDHDHIIESFTKMGDNVLTLTLPIEARADLKINIIAKSENQRKFASGFIITEIEDKVFAETKDGKIIGLIKDKFLYDINNEKNKIASYCRDHNLVIYKKPGIERVVEVFAKIHPVKRNITKAFTDTSLEEILKYNDLTIEQERNFRQKYNCEMLAYLINVKEIIPKKTFYQFEFNVINNINISNIIMSLKINIINENSFEIKEYKLNDKYKSTDEGIILYDETFRKITDNLTNRTIISFNPEEIETDLIKELITIFSADTDIDCRSTIQDKQELGKKIKNIQDKFTNIIRSIEDKIIYVAKSRNILKNLDINGRNDVNKNNININKLRTSSNFSNIDSIKSYKRRASIVEDIAEGINGIIGRSSEFSRRASIDSPKINKMRDKLPKTLQSVLGLDQETDLIKDFSDSPPASPKFFSRSRSKSIVNNIFISQ